MFTTKLPFVSRLACSRPALAFDAVTLSGRLCGCLGDISVALFVALCLNNNNLYYTSISGHVNYYHECEGSLNMWTVNTCSFLLHIL